MKNPSRLVLRLDQVLGAAVACILLVGGVLFALYPRPFEPPLVYDVTVQRLPEILPGTVVGDSPPAGWSHLIIKSHPHVGAGDVKQLSSSAGALSDLFFTAIVANLEHAGPKQGYRFQGAAIGVGMARSGRDDVIISSATQAEQGLDLSLFARIVLSKSEERMRRSFLVARSDTMAIVDASSLMVRNGKHRGVILRYALLVDAKTGQLDTLLWLLDVDDQGGYHGPVGALEQLPPNMLDFPVLHVDSREFFLGLPTETAFALQDMGRSSRKIACPDNLQSSAAQNQLTPELARELEQTLRLLCHP